MSGVLTAQAEHFGRHVDDRDEAGGDAERLRHLDTRMMVMVMVMDLLRPEASCLEDLSIKLFTGC